MERFLPRLAGAGRSAVEVRNRTWLGPPLYDLLRGAGVALVLADYYTMPGSIDLFLRLWSEEAAAGEGARTP